MLTRTTQWSLGRIIASDSSSFMFGGWFLLFSVSLCTHWKPLWLLTLKKKKRAACVFVLGVCFSLLPPFHLACPFLDTHAQVLASSSPRSYNLLSPLRSWPHGSCFKCSGLVHLQNLKTRGLWAHLTLKFLKFRDFPGGAVVKTLRSQFKGLGVQSLVRELDPTCCN